MSAGGPTSAQPDLEAGRKLFAQECRFVIGAAQLAQIPDDGLPEVAFAGRSNVGKSSLINALTGRRTLARISNTPGRTRQLNFFDLGGRLMIVDLPGYGYARVSRSESAAWQRLTRDYLRGRANLRRVCLLVDSRHGLKQSDHDLLDMLDGAAVSCQIILTKIDKLRPTAREDVRVQIAEESRVHPTAYPDVFVTSATDGLGIAELRAALAELTRSA